MTKETIVRIKLTASDGMVLTDGENYGRIMYVAENAVDKYSEITEAEFEAIEAAKMAEIEAENNEK